MQKSKINITLDRDLIDIILADADFRDSLMETIAKIQSGRTKWHSYEEVFG